MRLYCSVPDWEEYESATDEDGDDDPSFLRESTTDTDLLTDGGR